MRQRRLRTPRLRIGSQLLLGPDEAYPIIERLSHSTNLPLIAKPNAGMPDPKTGEYSVKPQEFAEKMRKIAGLGVRYIGGCCGTDPEYIRALKKMIDML
jgi:5-methyltetrahydrofolate--homocysteine methyltransferase